LVSPNNTHSRVRTNRESWSWQKCKGSSKHSTTTVVVADDLGKENFDNMDIDQV